MNTRRYLQINQQKVVTLAPTRGSNAARQELYLQQNYQFLMLLVFFSMHFWPNIVISYGSRLNSFSLNPSSGPMGTPEPFFWLNAAR